jgi:hypothetical protein
MLAHRNIAFLTPQEALGRSIFETVVDEWAETGTAYRSKSKIGQRFKSLESKDSTFAAFLIENDIKTSAMESLPPDRRAATVRKATTIVSMRDYFLESGPDKGKPAKLRTRKSLAPVYSGAEALFAITEGNPRWFKGIIGPLIRRLEKGNTEIPQAEQYRHVDRALTRFRSLLRTIPSPPWRGGQPTRGLLSFLDQIGDYFRADLLEGDFTLDPAGTVTVDSRTKPGIIHSLGDALNAGAIVSVDEVDLPSVAIRGKRFRLSYLLAPYYHLSLRVERAVSLSTALGMDETAAAESLFKKEDGDEP